MFRQRKCIYCSMNISAEVETKTTPSRLQRDRRNTLYRNERNSLCREEGLASDVCQAAYEREARKQGASGNARIKAGAV